MKKGGGVTSALEEVEKAMVQIQEGQEEILLSPQSAYIRRLQHMLAERNDLSSESHGQEPERRVRINKKESVS
jgi:predicted RNA-binding protein Jag